MKTLHIFSDVAIEPKCRHFRTCGGCKFQHIPYDEQLLQKENFVRACFGLEVEPILPCEPHWHYRNKMEYTFSQSRDGKKFLGLMMRKGRVENLEECFLTDRWFIQVLSRVREWWETTLLPAYHPPTNQGILRTLTLREGLRSKEKMVILTTSAEEIAEEDLNDFKEAVGEVDSVILRKQILQKKRPTRFEERLLHGKNHIHEFLYDEEDRKYIFRIRAASFFQPNTQQAESLYQLAMEFANIEEGETLFDLFCGTGSLGIFAAQKAKKVFGIECVSEAVEDAKENLSSNHIDNMEVIEGDVGEILHTLPERPSTVIVDPPRAGLGPKAIHHLLELQPEKIVYLSCNPLSQAEDCKALGYEIVRLQPVDQFPHTPHIENLALLRRKT